ncbi:MAG: methylmalonyl-CoA mutase family protein [Saprospiraceae bacterium]|nr:methylmalonyl-CoA mutase family protein [Saprospiraceae bacterium]
MKQVVPYQAKNKIRLVTAASLFDGHDAAINIMRRIMQSSGAEIIHLGHNRSVQEIVDTAIQEDVQGIAITSYQGGHNEYFKYMYDLLKEQGASHIKIFGGGGGTILPSEIKELHNYGITRIYSPDDGRSMGLQGMINDLLSHCDYPTGQNINGELEKFKEKHKYSIARLISAAENTGDKAEKWLEEIREQSPHKNVPVLGITGTGGSGKSSLVDELVRRFLTDFENKTIAVISVDPSKRKTGGALLGDRIRMNSISSRRVYMRSLATRQSNLSVSKHINDAVNILKAACYDLIILETSGIGQSDTAITDFSDVSLYVMTPEYGAASQLEKIDMLDFADVIALNKFDKRGALDALRDVKKQFKRNHNLWEANDEELPVFGTIASQFNDPGMNQLYVTVIKTIAERTGIDLKSTFKISEGMSEKIFIIPPKRTRYLSEISDTIRNYNTKVDAQSEIAEKLYGLKQTIKVLETNNETNHAIIETIEKAYEELELSLDGQNKKILANWKSKVEAYSKDEYIYSVRNKEIRVPTHTTSLSHTKIPRVSLPRYKSWGEILRWVLQENVPGEYPFTAGVFPFKRKGEDPTRMFAGEGNPERTNRRFHYVSLNMPAHRLSTAFDSVTLYGDDPDRRPDIYGKIGNAGVNICCVDDAKKLYSGFDLCSPTTSVSMTINGPAATICAFYMNAAIDQQCELYIKENNLEDLVEAKKKEKYDDKGLERPEYLGELPKGNTGLGLLLLGLSGDEILEPTIYEKLKQKALSSTRGTVQADILKEDQAQNTCIFSTEFSLRLMGDVQEYFIDHNVRNFYSVSISGYHIAEAGANPISQLAFTLANGFTFVEYYLSRGMDINKFGPNLSFFFSNGIDPEYAVIGRVARRIWAKAMREKYGADARAQKLKYHIQTSGRSLHAQEISFNDIRTTLQALYAIYDNCNSLHTNAYDEAITTPTEESVRRAMAIQLVINHEFGLAKNENPMQGSFITEELTDLVEEAIMVEFDRITDRGGVLGAMETMYQRGKIQEESLYYETLKHSGEFPIIGVNTFLSKEGSPTIIPDEVIRATEAEKEAQIITLKNLKEANKDHYPEKLRELQKTAVNNGNLFDTLMETVKSCSLGQITNALYEVGGQYRRNM